MAQDRHPSSKTLTTLVDTIVAVATAPGAAALAIIRLSGADARAIVETMLDSGATLKPRRATKATISDRDGQIDEAIVTFFPSSSSPTGEDLIELTVHGSPYIIDRIVRASLQRARLAQPGEFTQRAFLNGKLDLAQAEAVCQLVRARGEAAHRAAFQQLSGGLSKRVEQCREPLFDLLIRIEACLDHPEEDIPSLTAGEALERIAQTEQPIARLASTFARGKLTSDGARLALIGRPNAGKSSLLNALLGRDRAIVCPEPGTTRDTIEEPGDIAGVPAVLIDTAGLRQARDAAEKAGIERSEGALKTCDVALLVIDGSRPPDHEDREVFARVFANARDRGLPVITVLNKADLGIIVTPDFPRHDVAVSATKGTGLEALERHVAATIDSQAPLEPTIVTSARHHQALIEALQELRLARVAVETLGAQWEDRAASHLRQSLRQLGLIIGQGAPDEVLTEIFSRFCVGK